MVYLFGLFNAMLYYFLTIIPGADPEFGKGGCTLLKKVEDKKKVTANNGCPLPNVYTIKCIKIIIHNFIVKLHCLMNTVTALLE